MRIRHEDEDGIEVQMAPLIDCMFLLLIFFLVATTLKKMEKELPVKLPFADVAVEVKEDPTTLAMGIDSQGQFYVDGNPAGRQVCLDALGKAKASGNKVRIDADEATPYAYIIEMMNLCKMRGVLDVQFHTRDAKRR